MRHEHVWALLGVLCILSLFAMMLIGIRQVAAEQTEDVRDE
ncbi:hypothetical protein [Pimelobacter simplex]|uniref:Uncharacterized protein n=1 Tax=Nocardioides simplex TaxID=2045 RepID=A0A0C5XLA4_NOCSI|nr:hypothetical protein [Pimelobacter simplex]AJR18257.1 hypothetical protein KR76_00073 [Pimelobacter simplex]GEB12648.1 hypothetical protein NSI01_09630 [Pimelobacter simplex]SFM56384.1 hypothetical protein SAMN05421671_2383 [Pimelobacter simplex]